MGKLQLCVLDSCCTNSCLTKPHDVKLHRFPVDPSTKSKWEKWIRGAGGLNCKDFIATKSIHTVCSKHFKPSDYLNSKLCYKAVPSILPRSQTSRKITGAQTSSKNTEGSSQMSKDLPPIRLQIATGRFPEPGSPASSFVLAPVRLQPKINQSADQRNESPAYSVSVYKRDNNTGALTRTQFLSSSSNPSPLHLSSPVNGLLLPNDDSSQEPGKSKTHTRDSSPADFHCPVRAQKSLNMAADEIARTKRKLETMQLKFIRATKRIQTLTDILNQFKDERHSSEDNVEIKVCSSCRKVNVCQ